MADSKDRKLTTWLRRNGRWVRWTHHYAATLLHKASTDYGIIYTKHGQDYLCHEGEVSKIPYFVSLELQNVHRLTQQWGPYKFYNGFETTAEAEYLKKMFQYPHLTNRAQQKVTDIMFNYNTWIERDEEFLEILKKREQEVRNE